MFPSTFTTDNGFLGTGGTQFGAGGGFVPSQGNEGTQGIRNFSKQTTRAITIKQIKEAVANAPDDNFVLDGEDLNNITIVARVVRLVENSTNFDVLVDDGTGQWDVKLYVDSDEENAHVKRKECEPNHYVRIHGHLRSMDDKYPLVAFSIKQVIDFNEVSYHFLSCIYQHAHFTKGVGRPQNAAPGSAQKPVGVRSDTAGLDGDTPVLAAVRSIYSTAPMGASVTKVVESLRDKFPPNQIRDAVMALSEQGGIYITGDDTYKSCQF